jgi:hypothetical protein
LEASDERAILKIGVTGHQHREGVDWAWMTHRLNITLDGLQLPLEGWTSLAAGADQVFANAILVRGGTLVAVIPIVQYERFFTRPEDLQEYRRLHDASQRVIQLDDPESNRAFLSAGRRIVEECTLVFAIWDGKPSRDVGGTGDIVAYAQSLGRTIYAFNPVERSSCMLGDGQEWHV